MNRLFILIALSLATVVVAEPNNGKRAAYSNIEVEVYSLLKEGKQAEAESLLDRHLEKPPYSQRELFLRAVLKRSRFDVESATKLFGTVKKMDPGTIEGKCANLALGIDATNDVKGFNERLANVKSLIGLAQGAGDDITCKWLAAIMCYTYPSYIATGVELYKEVMTAWNPGPVLAHQSYANLILMWRRYDEALIHNEMAVKLEPASWSYDGLARTLCNLNRYKEACEAHEKAVHLDPSSAILWFKWGKTLESANLLVEAGEKYKKATDLDPTLLDAWIEWGYVLHSAGKNSEALLRYRKALELAPRNAGVIEMIERIESSGSK